jgi:hypothetical protein
MELYLYFPDMPSWICIYKLVVFSGELSTKLMLQKDERVKVMAEILRGIRVIKLHVWEDHFVDKIESEYDTTWITVMFYC